MGRVRRSARRFPRILKVLLALALTLPLALVWAGGAAQAEPSARDLQKQLRRLNGQADQAVERYLDAKIGLDQARASLGSLSQQVESASEQLDDLAIADRAYQAEIARLHKVEQEREQQVKRLAAEKDKVDQLVQRTQT